jgi:6,7-dimethyl-8-ribityllumazine synthase
MEPRLKGVSSSEVDGRGVRVAIVHTRWNERIVSSLTQGCVDELKRRNVTDIVVTSVPGAFELPFGGTV